MLSNTSNWRLIQGPSGKTLPEADGGSNRDRKSTRLNSSHSQISYAVFCLKKKKTHVASAALPAPPNDCRVRPPAYGSLLPFHPRLVRLMDRGGHVHRRVQGRRHRDDCVAA